MVANSQPPLAYLLDEAPKDIRVSTLPTTAKEVVLAKVRLLGSASYRGGRVDRGGHRQDPLPKELLSVHLKILEVLSGHAALNSVLHATFGVTDQIHSLVPVPRTRAELEREYFAVLYADASGQWHLAGFPMSEAEYRKWEEKFWSDERERMGIDSKR